MLILRRSLLPLFVAGLVGPLLMATPAWAEAGRQGRVVSAAWLQERLGKLTLLDASFTPKHLAGHIPGAVSADPYRYGVRDVPRAAMEKNIQSWGISPGSQIVVYDQGADMMATRLFYDLYYHGVPAEDLFILDGGLAGWVAQGRPVTKEATPPPPAGSYRVGALREEVRTRLPEFLVASGDRGRHALVEALGPEYHYGADKFFDRAGHVPGAVLMPSEDFFNPDKTFKSPDEMRRMLRYLGVQPGQTVHSHCGGGVAATVPWFALQFMAEHPSVKLYPESQYEWLRDNRNLPFATYSAPQLMREGSWLHGWNAPMLRAFGAAQLNIIDVRSATAYAMGHVPFAVNIAAEQFRSHLARPRELAALLGSAGVNPAHEVVVMADSGLTPDAALAFFALEQLGHTNVSVLMDSVDEWGLRGFELTKKPTLVGKPKTQEDITVPATTYAAPARAAAPLTNPQATRGEYPKVFVAAGKAAPSRTPEGKVVRLAYSDLLNANGVPKPAGELWKLITAAGVPRYAEVIVFADDLAEAAVNYYVFRLMGWPDVKVWAN